MAPKQRAASPSRFYGDGGTIHASTDLDVEVHDGQVVAVWYRCQQLPYRVSVVGPERVAEMVATGQGCPGSPESRCSIHDPR